MYELGPNDLIGEASNILKTFRKDNETVEILREVSKMISFSYLFNEHSQYNEKNTS